MHRPLELAVPITLEDLFSAKNGVCSDYVIRLADDRIDPSYYVGKAIEREPDRSDLRLKLLDILFVWGKENEFLDEARTLRERLGDGDTVLLIDAERMLGVLRWR